MRSLKYHILAFEGQFNSIMTIFQNDITVAAIEVFQKYLTNSFAQV